MQYASLAYGDGRPELLSKQLPCFDWTTNFVYRYKSTPYI